MPKNLVSGSAAKDVSAYVAQVVAKSGKDSGLLATAVQAPGAGKPAVEKGGKLSIPASPSGQLAYATNKASAEPGSVTIEMPNVSGVDHNLALETGEGGATPQGSKSARHRSSPRARPRSRSRSSRASTRSSARSPGTARRACTARSRSSSSGRPPSPGGADAQQWVVGEEQEPHDKGDHGQHDDERGDQLDRPDQLAPATPNSMIKASVQSTGHHTFCDR